MADTGGTWLQQPVETLAARLAAVLDVPTSVATGALTEVVRSVDAETWQAVWARLAPRSVPDDVVTAAALDVVSLRRQDRRLRRDMIALMMATTLAGGFLLGVVASGLGVPAVWMAPVILAASGLLWRRLR